MVPRRVSDVATLVSFREIAVYVGGQRVLTSIASADDGYDRSGDNRVFEFAPTGSVLFG